MAQSVADSETSRRFSVSMLFGLVEESRVPAVWVVKTFDRATRAGSWRMRMAVQRSSVEHVAEPQNFSRL